jgi:hypothetical protein
MAEDVLEELFSSNASQKQIEEQQEGARARYTPRTPPGTCFLLPEPISHCFTPPNPSMD